MFEYSHTDCNGLAHFNYKKGAQDMCKCKTAAEFEINGIEFDVRYICKDKALILRGPEGSGLMASLDIADLLRTERDELSEIIQGLDDQEVQRLMGYLEGWRDSDDE